MKKLIVIISLYICGISVPTTAFSYNCANKEEKAALDIRAMQSHLMVAALACGEHDQYNKFVKKFNGYLVDQSDLVKEFFDRGYSGNGQSQMNNFVTKVANAASSESLDTESKSYCRAASKLFKELIKSKPTKFEAIAAKNKFGKLHGVKECR